MNKKIILISFLILFSLTIGFENNVIAVDMDNTCSFEETYYGNIGGQYDNGQISTNNCSAGTGIFQLTTVGTPQNGNRHMIIDDGGCGWINISGGQIYNQSIWVQPINWGVGSFLYIEIFDLDLDPDVDEPLIKWRISGGGANVHFQDYYGNWEQPKTGTAIGANYCAFEIGMNTNQSVDYTLHYTGAGFTGNDFTPRTIKEDPYITGIRFTIIETGGEYAYIDLLNWSVGEIEIPTGDEYGDLSGYDYITSVRPYGTNLQYDRFNSYICSDSYLEHSYNVKMDCHIRAYDLYIGSYQWLMFGSKNSYRLEINGIPCGAPAFVVPYNDDYILRWYGLNVNIDNDYLVFELYQQNDNNYQGCLWSWVEVARTLDEGDYIIPIGYYSHPIVGLYGNGIVDGDWVLHPLVDNTDKGDIGYTVYYTSDPDEFDNPSYSDTISTNKETYVQYEYVSIDGTVSTFESDNYVHLYKDSIEINNDSFPRKIGIAHYDFSFGFTPELIGDYEVKVIRAGATVASDTFTVEGGHNESTYDYILWTSPPKTKPLTENFLVKWYYNNAQSREGNVFVFRSEAESTDLENAYTIINISSNGYGQFSHPAYPYYGTLYLKMYVKVTENYYEFTGAYCKHFVTDRETEPSIVAEYKELFLSVSNPTATQYFHGFNPHTGANTEIQLNNKTIKSLMGEDNYFHYRHLIDHGGDYNVTLVINNPDGKIILAYDTFFVGGAGDEEAPEEPKTWYEELFGDYTAIVGIGIIIMFLLMPMGVVMSRGYSPRDVPSLIYVGMGSLGAVLAVYWGFLGAEVILLMVVALFSTTIITIMLKIRG